VIAPFEGVWPRIHPGAWVAPNAVVLGDVEIGEGASVWYGCVLRGDTNFIRIGARSNIQDGTIIHVNAGREATVIGADVTVGHAAIIHACTLEDGAFVGMGATVLDGAVVESGAVLAACGVLPRASASQAGNCGWATRPGWSACWRRKPKRSSPERRLTTSSWRVAMQKWIKSNEVRGRKTCRCNAKCLTCDICSLAPWRFFPPAPCRPCHRAPSFPLAR
jgi:carbonic anhydrase/acetyltransferase-like protein (isoleucine patch superfamily)